MTARSALMVLLAIASLTNTSWVLVRTDAARAAATVANFLRYVEAGQYAGADALLTDHPLDCRRAWRD